MDIKITGLEEMQQKFEELARKAKELDGEHNVPIAELFPEAFMRQHTSLASFQELIEKGGFTVKSSADLAAAISDDAWDQNVRANTSFGSWQEMHSAGTKEWTRNKLGL